MMKVGIIQMNTTSDKEENILSASEKVASCAAQGANLVILPEIFNSPYSTLKFREYSEPQGGHTWQELSKMASENHVYLIGGSIPEFDNDKVYNTSFTFNPNGIEIAKHRKVHLFDIDVEGGQKFKESDSLTPGNTVTVFEIPEFGIVVGVCICFDFRFPDLARLMVQQGASMIVVPAAFNMTTGPAHWELMFRQRAVDNQCFTIGVAPSRNVDGGYVSYANSIVVSPWGDVVFRADEKEVVEVVEIDLNKVESVRKQLPLLSARRTDIYEIRQNDYSNNYKIVDSNDNDQNVFNEANVDEILEIYNLLKKTTKDLHNKGINQWTEEWKIIDIRKLVLERTFFVKKINGKIIGICNLGKNVLLGDVDSLYLSKVALLPEYQRKGIGREIVEKAIGIAKERGKNIILDCWNENEKLKQFYTSIGFQYICDQKENEYTISLFKLNLQS